MCFRILVRDDCQVNAFAGVGRGHAEVIHGQALGWAPVDAQATANAAALVDDHGGGVWSEFASGHLRQADIAIDRVDALGADHFDAVVRAYIHAAVAENAAVSIDKDVELALQAALGFLEADAFGHAHFGFE